MRKIPYTKPSITELEIQYVNDAVTNGWGESCYSYINKFEKAFADYLDVEYAVATSSATGALHLGLAALGIERDDEVIVANANWVASIAPILYLGAKPIFVDVNPVTWCIEPNLIEAAITNRTKAILAVHLYGNMCEMDALLEIANRNNIYLIEDSAEAIGSSYKGKKAGSIGTFGAFSFHGTKTLTTGEGGILTTNCSQLYEKVLTLSNHGRHRNQTKQFWPDELGYKYKMSNIQAALGLAQVERIDHLIGRKREIFKYYHDNLNHLDFITMNPILDFCENGFWMPTIVLSDAMKKNKDALIDNFKRENIDARVFFWELSTLPFINEKTNTPIAKMLSDSALNLPSYHDISYEDQDRIIQMIVNLK